MKKSEMQLKTDTFGTCSYGRTSPKQLAADTRVVNIFLSFEEALKLNMAIDECVRKLGRYNRATKAGKGAALNLAVHLDQCRISVHEGNLEARAPKGK
jgi:hypothetical protein